MRPRVGLDAATGTHRAVAIDPDAIAGIPRRTAGGEPFERVFGRAGLSAPEHPDSRAVHDRSREPPRATFDRAA